MENAQKIFPFQFLTNVVCYVEREKDSVFQIVIEQ